MASGRPPSTPPPSWRERTQYFLLYGFAISIALHLIVGPFINFQRPPDEQPEKIETVRVDKMPTPPPTPKPTPTPRPTPPPTPTPPPKTPPPSTPKPQPPQRIKITTEHQTSKSQSGPTEETNQYTQGSTKGVPQGVPSGVPSAPPATAPPTAAPTPVPTPAPTPVPTPTPLACANPNVRARVVRAVQPETPPIAQQQGITGEVTIRVTLSQDSQLLNAKVEKTANPVLNNAALTAARQSTYQTEVQNCKKIAADYLFIVEFTNQ